VVVGAVELHFPVDGGVWPPVPLSFIPFVALCAASLLTIPIFSMSMALPVTEKASSAPVGW